MYLCVYLCVFCFVFVCVCVCVCVCLCAMKGVRREWLCVDCFFFPTCVHVFCCLCVTTQSTKEVCSDEFDSHANNVIHASTREESCVFVVAVCLFVFVHCVCVRVWVCACVSFLVQCMPELHTQHTHTPIRTNTRSTHQHTNTHTHRTPQTHINKCTVHGKIFGGYVARLGFELAFMAGAWVRACVQYVCSSVCVCVCVLSRAVFGTFSLSPSVCACVRVRTCVWCVYSCCCTCL